jgi:NPCBM-associated, NEW3 domain of alpha-galactosidase
MRDGLADARTRAYSGGHTGAGAARPLVRVSTLGAVAGALLGFALLVCVPAGGRAQNYGNYNPRDDQYRLLGMTRAQADYETALREYERVRDLRARNLASDADLERATSQMQGARVNYLQAALAIVFASPHVVIDRAVKYQRGDGQKYVRVTVRNESATTAEGMKLSDVIDSTLLRQLRPDEVPNVYVALKDDSPNGGAIIASPYEARIPVLHFGQPVTLEFRLLKDVDVVTVSMSYANQSSDRRVLLEKDASANIVSVQSSQFSQEGDLGTQVTYDLQFERFTADQAGVRLEVGGLPREIRYEFRDPTTNARLTQLRFPEGTTSQRLSLVLFLPQRDAGRFPVDQPISFWAFALDREGAARFAALARDTLTAAEAAQIPSGKVRLELNARGVGRLDVGAANLYQQITRGDSVTMEFVLRNTGSRGVDNVRLAADLLPDWRATFTPELVPSVAIDGEARVRLVLVPPRDIPVGDYDVKVRTIALSADRQVETEDKTVRVHVTQPAAWVGTVLLALLLVALVGGMVWFGLRLTKR